MTAVVFDTSVVIALLRDEPGSDVVAGYVGRAAMSAVNLQELVAALTLRGLSIDTIKEIVAELRLDIRAHDQEAAFAAARLAEATRRLGNSLGDRSCLGLAIALGVPLLTTDPRWGEIEVAGLKVHVVR